MMQSSSAMNNPAPNIRKKLRPFASIHPGAAGDGEVGVGGGIMGDGGGAQLSHSRLPQRTFCDEKETQTLHALIFEME